MTKGLPFTAPLAFILEGTGLPPEPAGPLHGDDQLGRRDVEPPGSIEAIPGGDWVVGSHTYARRGTVHDHGDGPRRQRVHGRDDDPGLRPARPPRAGRRITGAMAVPPPILSPARPSPTTSPDPAIPALSTLQLDSPRGHGTILVTTDGGESDVPRGACRRAGGRHAGQPVRSP